MGKKIDETMTLSLPLVGTIVIVALGLVTYLEVRLASKTSTTTTDKIDQRLKYVEQKANKIQMALQEKGIATIEYLGEPCGADFDMSNPPAGPKRAIAVFGIDGGLEPLMPMRPAPLIPGDMAGSQ